MKFIEIEWNKICFDNLDEISEDYYFYALLKKCEILYIGSAYKMNVKDEIKQNINRLEIETKNLSICLGSIVKTINVERITWQLIRDVECLLIYACQPKYNTQCKKYYTGRKNLIVLNSTKKCICSSTHRSVFPRIVMCNDIGKIVIKKKLTSDIYSMIR
ncbi:MAG: hypothetical protein N2449_03190 [Bacteroidales bacterium]|nr:hypothetical protein [Bacteroidales bacterium]